jgi:hypothetical protein
MSQGTVGEFATSVGLPPTIAFGDYANMIRAEILYQSLCKKGQLFLITERLYHTADCCLSIAQVGLLEDHVSQHAI